MTEIEIAIAAPAYSGLTLPDETKLEDTPPFYRFPLELEAQTFWLELVWNQRSSVWLANILTAEEEPIIVGCLVASGIPLFRKRQDSRLPKGTIFVKDTSGTNDDPGRTDLGTRHRLYHFTAAEVNAL